MGNSILPPISIQVPIVDDKGRPTSEFQRLFQKAIVSSNLNVDNGVIGLADIASKTILANKTGVTGAPAACTLSDILDFIGSAARGDILYRGTSGWARLPAGTSGTFLKTQGTGADPVWASPTTTPTVFTDVWPNGSFSSNDSGAFATLANVIVPYASFSVDRLYGGFNNTTIGNVYNMFIATINSSYAITGTVATATPFTTTATGSQQKTFNLSAPVTLNAGTNYIIALVITNGTGTSACRALGFTSAAYSAAPVDIAAMMTLFGTNSKRVWYAQNSAAPTSATASSNGTGMYGLGFRATL